MSSLVCALLAAPALLAQSNEAQPFQQALDAWRAEHGASWQAAVDDGTGYAEFLFGGNVPATMLPQSDAEWFTLARQALAQAQALHGIEPVTLVEDRALYLPLGMVGSSDKLTVRFRQQVRGVPVEGGAVNVLFAADGALLSIQTRALPAIADLLVSPALSSARAAEIGARAFERDEHVRGSVAAEPRLVVAQLEEAGQRRGRLVWRVDVQWLPADAAPIGFEYLVDAGSGALAGREPSVHFLDVGGTVSTRATPGVAPDSATNPETQQLVQYGRVQSSAGTVFTDANGNFNFPGVAGPLNCTFTYVGTFNQVNNDQGAPYSLVQSLTGTGNQVQLNPVDSEHITAQANAFVGVNQMRDWVRSVNPLDGTADFVHTANCNINSSCNAYFNGSSINFFIASGGCVNTCYSTVIAHEDGHWLNVLYGTGNGPDGMGEGNADMFAMYLYDTNIVAQDFFGVGQPIRDGLNTRQFCGDCCGGCYGGVHANGEVWMGAGWKIRRNLNNSLGNAPGDAVANALFMGWMNSFNQTEIKTLIETQWLTLDDNDGNLSNGTPHFFEIDGGFVEQGFPGVPFDPIAINSLSQLPDTTNETGPYGVQADVVSNIGGSITSVELFYRVGWSGGFNSLAMSASGNQWTAAIPGQSAQSKVFYYMRAADNAGNQRSFPTGGATNPLFFGIGNKQDVLCDSFEVPGTGWSASTGSFSSGAFTQADPLGTFNGAIACQPEFDNTAQGTLCFFTGQGTLPNNPNENDVDGGPFTLTSPPIQIAFDNAQIDYAYWFYNDDGDDSLLVQVSTNGTAWTTARTHLGGTGGWRTDRIDVRSFISPTPVMYVRFSVSDSPNNSITEVAIDDVCISTLAPTGCAQPVVFCASKIDSSFCRPRIGYQGYARVSGTSALNITLSDASAARNGLLFYGLAAQTVPYLGGALCAVSPLRRTPVQNTGGSSGCTGSLNFDFNALIRSGLDSNLVAGQTVSAQYYYRDPLDTFQVGLSNGVHFTICP